MRDLRKFGRRINLPSTASIVHELKMMQALDAVRSPLNDVAGIAGMDRIGVLERLLAAPDIHDAPSPAHGMEMLRRGNREQELLRLLAGGTPIRLIAATLEK